MRKLTALLTVVALAVAACGDSAGDTTTTELSPTTTTQTATAAPTTSQPAPTTSQPAPTTTAQPTADPIATVEALFDAWNRGDVDTYIALQSDGVIESLGKTIVDRTQDTGLSYEQAEQIVRNDFTFWYFTGTEWILSDCEASPGGSRPGDVVTCQLIINTGFLKAQGEADSGSVVRYIVEDGTVASGSSYLISVQHALAQASFNEWVEERIEDGTIEEGTVPCSTTSIYIPPLEGGQSLPTPVCAQWIGDHLDEWKADLDSERSS